MDDKLKKINLKKDIYYTTPELKYDIWVIFRINPKKCNNHGELKKLGRFEFKTQELAVKFYTWITKIKCDELHEYEFLEIINKSGDYIVYYFTFPEYDKEEKKSFFYKKQLHDQKIVEKIYADNKRSTVHSIFLQESMCNLIENKAKTPGVKYKGEKNTIKHKTSFTTERRINEQSYKIHQRVTELTLINSSRNEIMKTLVNEFPDKSKKTLKILYEREIERLNNFILDKFDIDLIIEAHVSLYEKMFELCSSINYYLGKNRALEGVQKLRRVYNQQDENVIEVNQQNNFITNANSNILYNTDALTKDEKDKLFFYLAKIREIKKIENVTN